MENKEQIKIRLLEELSLAKLTVKKYTELVKPIAPENVIGRVSRMDAINNKSVNQASLKNVEIKLNNIKIALSKINDADFGLCVRCKIPIPLGIILLMPQVITCVNCAR